MGKRDRRGARSGRKRRAKASKASSPAEDESSKPAWTHVHARFGPIPIVNRAWVDAAGRSRVYADFDPDYRPPMPPGAVRGDPRRQLGRGAFDTPHYFYVDRDRVCVQCREDFVFGAAEQKYWYESLAFNFASVAIRCPACRRRQRSVKARHHAVGDAKRQLADQPKDPAASIALAEAIVELWEVRRQGKLDEAIAAARRARRLLPKRAAKDIAWTHYWEARAQASAGREAKARMAYLAFLADAGSRVHRKAARHAEAWLAGHPA